MVALTVVDARPPAMAAGIPLLAADRTVADHRMAVDHPTVAARLTAVDLMAVVADTVGRQLCAGSLPA